MAVTSRKQPDRALAICAAGDAEGALVYMSGPVIGGKYAVSTADPGDFSKLPAVAMIVSKLSLTECIIQFRGPITGIHSGLTPGEMLFLAADGSVDNGPPAPDSFVQVIGAALSTNVVGLEPSPTVTHRRA
jgi:hypothetical protein